MPMFLSENNLADILGTSLRTVQTWGEQGVYPVRIDRNGRKGFNMEDLTDKPAVKAMLESGWDAEATVKPRRSFTSVELFAGCGGLALGIHKAGFRHVLLNEIEPVACRTLRRNRPDWKV